MVERISLTGRVRKEEEWNGVKEEGNSLNVQYKEEG